MALEYLTDSKKNLVANHTIVAMAMILVFVPFAAVAGVVLLAIAVLTVDWQTFPLGVTGIAIGGVG